MPRTERKTEALAREAAERIERDLERGVQLGLLPEIEEPDLPDAGGKRAGRPAGARNKGSSQLRDWLAARGMRMPEEVIAEMAGLHSGGKDAFAFALAQAERLLAHVGESAENRIFKQGVGHVVLDAPWRPSPAEFLETFKFFYATARQAASDLMPYGTPKASPDVSVTQNTTVIVPAQPAPRPGPDAARDVTPDAARIERRMMPADVAYEIERNQELSAAGPSVRADAHSDATHKPLNSQGKSGEEN